MKRDLKRNSEKASNTFLEGYNKIHLGFLMKKVILLAILTILLTMNHGLAKIAKKKTLSAPPRKCQVAATSAAKKALAEEGGVGTGLVEGTLPQVFSLKNGNIYIFAGFMERVFDWEVIIVVDRDCKVQNSFVNPL